MFLRRSACVLGRHDSWGMRQLCWRNMVLHASDASLPQTLIRNPHAGHAHVCTWRAICQVSSPAMPSTYTIIKSDTAHRACCEHHCPLGWHRFEMHANCAAGARLKSCSRAEVPSLFITGVRCATASQQSARQRRRTRCPIQRRPAAASRRRRCWWRIRWTRTGGSTSRSALSRADDFHITQPTWWCALPHVGAREGLMSL